MENDQVKLKGKYLLFLLFAALLIDGRL